MDAQATQKTLASLRHATAELRTLSSDLKTRALEAVAALLAERQPVVLAANAEDLAALPETVAPAFRDRLTLNPARLAQMRESLKQVAALPDPVGEVVETRTLANGLKTRRERSPLGVIFMIFESRPNVAIESFSLGFKSGNAMILRGGKESMRTVGALYSVIGDALESVGVSRECFWGITDPDRALTHHLLGQNRFIDVVVPRGGEALIEHVVRTTTIPVIKNDRGLCHVYLHEDADAAMAVEIVANSKCQRPGVCNAMETLLVHESRARELLPLIHEKLCAFGVRWFCEDGALAILQGREGVVRADESSFDTEYLDFALNCRVVRSLDEALEHIERHGSRHSEAIITRSAESARKFEYGVDAAAVYWNASTRFTDGFELGLGGELGISTQKLHVRGPVGLRELTSPRWFIEGTGQVRA